MKNLTEQPIWHKLQEHYDDIRSEHMRDWFANDSERFDQFSIKFNGLLFDYSRNRVSNDTLGLLFKLAEAANLKEKIDALFSEHPVNFTENKPALHTLLRDQTKTAVSLTNPTKRAIVSQAQADLFKFVDAIHSKAWLGITGKAIKHIVNIGIGGSHVGPMMATEALKDFAVSDLSFHFISTVDPTRLHDVLKQIDPETTLFIISSKSFSTVETMTNAGAILAWLHKHLGAGSVSKHIVAVTANANKAHELGIPERNIFTFWDWVGGRYSIWSAIGLPLILMIGTKQFSEFLLGAHEVDIHFRNTEFSKNIPVLLGLLGIWYANFFHTQVQAVVPYSHRLRHLVPYLQQAEMESNGKSAASNGNFVDYQTASVIFGQEGCDGQHTYHQLLHQGKQIVPVDFILIANANNPSDQTQHDLLLASALGQAYALMHGKTAQQAMAELKDTDLPESELALLSRHQAIAGNKPCNLLVLDKLTPKNFGALLAIYEHKIFVQSAIWDINAFDQWGVELGKKSFTQILRHIHAAGEAPLDPATQKLIDYFNRTR